MKRNIYYSVFKRNLIAFIILLSSGNSFISAQTPMLFGMTSAGGPSDSCFYGCGAMISYNLTTNAENELWGFGIGNDGKAPYGDLVYDSQNGLYYGMTSAGGGNGLGSIFSFNPTIGAETILWSFGNVKDGRMPYGDLVYDAKDSLFYGMTLQGGSAGSGTIISFKPADNTENVVWNFGSGKDAASPYGSLSYYNGNGLFYGMTSGGGSIGNGAIISFNPATNTEKVVWSFTDGEAPYGDLVYHSGDSLFYGMTYGGGGGYGAIITFNPVTNTEAIVYDFSTGKFPMGNLVFDSANGLFYGLTHKGGGYGEGSIISFDPVTKTEAQVWYFGTPNDGTYPYKNLVYDPKDSLFYGMTYNGGNNIHCGGNGCGIIFSFSPATNKEKVVWNFGNRTDGVEPYGSLVYNSNNGLLYGMTLYGGSVNSAGAIIAFNPVQDTEAIVWNFEDVKTDAHVPYGDFVYDSATGLLYGMTSAGGTNNGGTIVSFNLSNNSESVLWNFGSGTDGKTPYGGFVFDTINGLYYGTTLAGGTNGEGTIITFNPKTNAEAVVYNFAGGSDGAGPHKSFVYDANDSLFYGMTITGGTNNLGTIITFNPKTNSEAVVWNFGNAGDGTSPRGNLVYNANKGLLYGMTPGGGNDIVGTIFSFNPVTDSEKVVYNFQNTTDGNVPDGDLTYDPLNGLYYGTTSNGGYYYAGSVISFNPGTNAEKVVYSFPGAGSGAIPLGTLAYDATTDLFYGMAYEEGTYSEGVIFSFNPKTNGESALWALGSGTDGAYPYGDFILVNNITQILTPVNNIASPVSCDIKVYPNPGNGKFTIQSSVVSGKSSVEIYNSLGQEILSQLSITRFPFSFDLSSQPSGIYLYRVVGENGNLEGEGKLIIQR